MQKYLELLSDILYNGEKREDRTGIGTYSLFGKSLTFDLSKGFPAVTTKYLNFKSVAAELAGFLAGVESALLMRHYGTKIWDANANASKWQASPYCRGPDDMGPVYGSQWRNFNKSGVDQLAIVVNNIIENPTDRRLLVSSWNPAAQHLMCLPPCHVLYQFYVRDEAWLDCQWYIRSVDTFLGMPFDIASYALLVHIIAQQTELVPGIMTMISGDTHIYLNHVEQVVEQLRRQPYALPQLIISDEANIDNFHPDMTELKYYNHHPVIKASMAV